MDVAGVAQALWQFVQRQLRLYRELAPLAGLAYALWQKRAAEAAAAAALSNGRFMQQCTVLLVDVDGLRKTNTSGKMTVPTLFSRTLRALMFENPQMVDLVSEAANRTTPNAPLLELGPGGWLVMANINAHLMEVCGSFGHVAAACGAEAEIVEMLFGLVNDRMTTSRQQLRVYVVRESQLRDLPSAAELDLRRGSSRSAYSVLRAMAKLYGGKGEVPRSSLANPELSITSGLPSGMGRTWFVFPKAAVSVRQTLHTSAVTRMSAL